MKNNKKGFTLVELLVVIAILAVLVILAVPAVLKYFSKSKVDAMKIQEGNIEDAGKLYLQDYCEFPIDDTYICPITIFRDYTEEGYIIYDGELALEDLVAAGYIEAISFQGTACTGNVVFINSVPHSQITCGTKYTSSPINGDDSSTTGLAYEVEVIVNNGEVSPATSTINGGETGTFTITPSDRYKLAGATIDCTNDQSGTIINSILSIRPTSDTVCTVDTVAMTPYTVTNLVANGSLTSSTLTGWSSDVSSVNNTVSGTITENGLYIEDLSSSSGNWSFYNYDFISNHVYYEAIENKMISATSGLFYNAIRDTSGNFEFSVTSGTASNNYVILSQRFTATSITSKLQIGSGSIPITTSYTKNVILIDLTNDFGEGNEPSQSWCDANIDYFNGTSTIYK